MRLLRLPSCLLPCLLCLSSLLHAEPAPGTARGRHAFTFEDMVRLGRVGEPQVSPAGNELCFVRTLMDPEKNRSTSSLFLLPLASLEPRQLTFPPPGAGAEAPAVHDSNPRFSPDGRRLAFVSTRAGGTPQLYVLPLAGGEAQRLTDLPGGASEPVWLPDGRALIVQAPVFPECAPLPEGEECNRRRAEAQDRNPIKARVVERLYYRHWDAWFDGRRTHLLKVPAEPGAFRPLDLTPGDSDTPPVARAGDRPYVVSPDGKELAFVGNRGRDLHLSTNHDLFLLSLSDPRRGPRNLTAGSDGCDTTPRYSPDGRYLAYLSQKRPGFESERTVLWVHDRHTGKGRALTEAFDANAGEPTWSRDSRRIYFTTSLLGRGRIEVVDVAAGGTPPRELAVADADDLQLLPQAQEETLVFRGSSFSRAPEVFRLPISKDPKGGPALPAPLTGVNDRAFAALQLGKATDLWGRTGDGRRLHSFLVTPAGFDAGRRYPAVVLIHGGPQGAWEDHWHWRWNPQIYAGAGYVVLMVNPRGSEGYGQRFVDEVSGDWGGRAYDDIMRAVDQLAALPYVDRARIGALGASYGGYMVNWIAGHTDRFAALVSHDGVYDPRSMHGETEELWFPRWEFGGDPWNSELYEKWNPARFADRFKTPMLVVTSERDFRVPVGQGMQLFTALQLRKVPSKMLIFPDENHWVLKPGNARLWHATVLDWLHRYLGGAAADARALQSAGCYAR